MSFLIFINPLTAGAAYIQVFIFYQHIKYHLLNMLKIKCDINQQYLKTVDLHFVNSEHFSLTWSCGSRQRDTTSSGWKFRLNNLAAKELNRMIVSAMLIFRHLQEWPLWLWMLQVKGLASLLLWKCPSPDEGAGFTSTVKMSQSR